MVVLTIKTLRLESFTIDINIKPDTKVSIINHLIGYIKLRH